MTVSLTCRACGKVLSADGRSQGIRTLSSGDLRTKFRAQCHC